MKLWLFVSLVLSLLAFAEYRSARKAPPDEFGAGFMAMVLIATAAVDWAVYIAVLSLKGW